MENDSGITNMDGAKMVARNLFEMYDKDRSSDLNKGEVGTMISDIYKSFNRQYNPKTEDIEEYSKILDINSDGMISYQDIENICIKYLVHTNVTRNIQDSIKIVRKEKVKKATRYTPEVEAKLELARRLFNRVDSDKSGFIEEDEVPKLLRETYKEMGNDKFIPSAEDVKIWMIMADENQDGKVSLPEYETLVIRSLRNSGFKIENENIVF